MTARKRYGSLANKEAGQGIRRSYHSRLEEISIKMSINDFIFHFFSFMDGKKTSEVENCVSRKGEIGVAASSKISFKLPR